MTLLRPATAEDVASLAATERDLFGADAWSEDAVRGEVLGAGRHALVADEDGAVVGYAITLRSDDVADLQRIAVRPAQRRRGLAARLLEELLDTAGAEGATRCLLEVSATNTGALAFYTGAGFVEIDRRRRYYRDGSDAVVMSRPLGRTAFSGRG